MATEAELETLAAWLEQKGFVSKKRRFVTTSYLRIVLGAYSTEQLQAIGRLLAKEAREHELEQSSLPEQRRKAYSVKWLALRRMTE